MGYASQITFSTFSSVTLTTKGPAGVSVAEPDKVSFHACKTNQCWLSPVSQPPLPVSAWHPCQGSNMCNFMHIWTWILTAHHTTSCAHLDRQFQLWEYFTAPTRTLMCNMFTNPATLPLSVAYCMLNLSPPLSLCVHQNSICWSVTPGLIRPKSQYVVNVNVTSVSDVPHDVQCFAMLPYNTKVLGLNLRRDKAFFHNSANLLQGHRELQQGGWRAHAVLELQITNPWYKLYHTASWILGGQEWFYFEMTVLFIPTFSFGMLVTSQFLYQETGNVWLNSKKKKQVRRCPCWSPHCRFIMWSGILCGEMKVCGVGLCRLCLLQN